VNERTAAFAAALAASFLGVSPAGADLGTDATRLEAAWRSHGEVRRLRPRLAERGAPTVLFLPLEAGEGGPRLCSSVAVLSPTSTHFTVRAVGGGPPTDAQEDWPKPSLAGLVQLTFCGSRRERISTLLVEMRSPRAVLEVVSVDARGPVPPAVEILRRRDPGPIAPLGASSPKLAPLPLAVRLAAVRARARRDGARAIAEENVRSSERGTGAVRATLAPGCHRFELLAEPGADAEPSYDLTIRPLVDAAASTVSIEHGQSLDAAVTVCAGERSSFNLEFAGAPSGVPVSVVTSHWPLPDGLPDSWSATARARVAATLWRHAARISGPPVEHALGVDGPTLMPTRVEPGACYVGVLVAVRGLPQGLALAVASGGVSSQNHGGHGGDGTLVSFCARGRDMALLEADSRGVGLFWLFALFQNGRIAVGGVP
jgi:hypothetical protein